MVFLSPRVLLARVYNALLSGTGVRATRSVAYGEHDRQKLDVYRPSGPGGEVRPVVVFLYGGAWESGRRRMYYFVARSLVERGCVVVIPDYRLYPEVRYPAFLEDTAAAVHWVARHVGEHGGDPDRLFLAGHSAGAYNAAAVTYDRRWLRTDGAFPGTIRGFIGLAGLYDFLPIEDETLRRIFGSAEDLEATQPVNFVGPHSPPTLLVAGKDDDRVNPWNSRSLAKSLHEAGVDYRFELIEDTGHVELVLSLGPWFRSRYPTLDAVDVFVRRHAREPRPSGRPAGDAGEGP